MAGCWISHIVKYLANDHLLWWNLCRLRGLITHLETLAVDPSPNTVPSQIKHVWSVFLFTSQRHALSKQNVLNLALMLTWEIPFRIHQQWSHSKWYPLWVLVQKSFSLFFSNPERFHTENIQLMLVVPYLVIPGNPPKYVSTNRSLLRCKTLPAHFSNNMLANWWFHSI